MSDSLTIGVEILVPILGTGVGGLGVAIRMLWVRGNEREDQIRCLMRNTEKEHSAEVQAMAVAHRDDLKVIMNQLMDLQKESLATIEALRSAVEKLSYQEQTK